MDSGFLGTSSSSCCWTTRACFPSQLYPMNTLLMETSGTGLLILLWINLQKKKLKHFVLMIESASLTAYLDLCHSIGVDLDVPRVHNAVILLALLARVFIFVGLCFVAQRGAPYNTLGRRTASTRWILSFSFSPHLLLPK